MKIETACTTRGRTLGRSGSTLIEFVLAGSFIFVPLLVGTVTVGMSVLEAIEVTALNRDAGHMFAQGVDFSQGANQNLLVKIAGNLNISPTGGDGVVILSEIDGTGTNTGVIARRFVIGDATLRASSFGTPDMIDSGGTVTSDASATATNFTPAVMPMVNGQVAYVAETYFNTSAYDWVGLLRGTGIYVRAVF
jgi:hypothetical protein